MLIKTNVYQTHNKLNRFPKKLKLLIMVIYFILIFILDYLFSSEIYKNSIIYQEKMQTVSKTSLKLMQVISIIGSVGGYAIIFLIIFNFTNILKSYLILILMLTANLIVSILKLVYQSPRPYFYSQNSIQSYGCETGYGNPSGHSLAAGFIYLMFWELFINNKFTKNKHHKIIRSVSLIFILIFIGVIMISRMFVGAHSLDQILFGFSIGLGLFLTLKWILGENLYKIDNFFEFLKLNPLFYIVPNIIIVILYVFLYIFVPQTNEVIIWEERIKEKGCNIVINDSFNNDCLTFFFVFFANVFAYFGMKLELQIIFKNDRRSWENFNFFEGAFNSTFSISSYKDNQWNHTKLFVSLLRLIVVLLICGILLLPAILINYNDDIWIVQVFKMFVPVTFCLFSLYCLKIYLRYFRLIRFNFIRTALLGIETYSPIDT